MDYVIVKVKRLQIKPYRKLLSDCRLYQNVDIDIVDCIPYIPDHNLDEESWFSITDFSQKSYCLPIIKQDNLDSKDYEDLRKTNFRDINYLISVQSSNLYFQKITTSTFINKKGIVFFGEVAQLEEDSTRLIIKDTPDAIYFKDSDILIFKDLAKISSIFKDIDILFKEATQAEVSQFLIEPFIKLGNDFNENSVSKPNRRRISLALEVLSSLPLNKRKKMFNYINLYCDAVINFDEDTQQFEINSDKDLKHLIYGIQERFYTTSLGQEKRLANSVITLSQ